MAARHPDTAPPMDLPRSRKIGHPPPFLAWPNPIRQRHEASSDRGAVKASNPAASHGRQPRSVVIPPLATMTPPRPVAVPPPAGRPPAYTATMGRKDRSAGSTMPIDRFLRDPRRQPRHRSFHPDAEDGLSGMNDDDDGDDGLGGDHGIELPLRSHQGLRRSAPRPLYRQPGAASNRAKNRFAAPVDMQPDGAFAFSSGSAGLEDNDDDDDTWSVAPRAMSASTVATGYPNLSVVDPRVARVLDDVTWRKDADPFTTLSALRDVTTTWNRHADRITEGMRHFHDAADHLNDEVDQAFVEAEELMTSLTEFEHRLATFHVPDEPVSSTTAKSRAKSPEDHASPPELMSSGNEEAAALAESDSSASPASEQAIVLPSPHASRAHDTSATRETTPAGEASRLMAVDDPPVTVKQELIVPSPPDPIHDLDPDGNPYEALADVPDPMADAARVDDATASPSFSDQLDELFTHEHAALAPIAEEDMST
ncbi:hypothetical protein CXG81DRAFT_17182 [Caulochytrium protostelioides]|uniref:Uncharacterized protein n=1 Tax=Caulochytrium protostelioides TaxID=1555241 RepID=A0A4P9XCQ5_9FUNG|nr:hypothetical protein CXG81DRAFT_17182 [Caulochytrium protostelioides]|eukprot:RKP03225.1 hypothetical protein CXG81DRAFT_17182 [Caulochytrium protostelioides]